MTYTLTKTLFISVGLFLLSLIGVFAAPLNGGDFTAIQDSVTAIGKLINSLTAIIVSVAFLFLFWNIAQFMRQSDDAKREDAKKKIIWSVIAIFVLVSIWGIIGFAGDVLGIEQDDVKSNVNIIPTFNTQSR